MEPAELAAGWQRVRRLSEHRGDRAAIEFCHDTELERFGSIAAIERY